MPPTPGSSTSPTCTSWTATAAAASASSSSASRSRKGRSRAAAGFSIRRRARALREVRLCPGRAAARATCAAFVGVYPSVGGRASRDRGRRSRRSPAGPTTQRPPPCPVPPRRRTPGWERWRPTGFAAGRSGWPTPEPTTPSSRGRSGQKIPWYRAAGSPWGRLRVTGSRIDAPAAPLRFSTGTTYPFRIGFQSSSLLFSEGVLGAPVGLTRQFAFVVRVEPDDGQPEPRTAVARARARTRPGRAPARPCETPTCSNGSSSMARSAGRTRSSYGVPQEQLAVPLGQPVRGHGRAPLQPIPTLRPLSPGRRATAPPGSSLPGWIPSSSVSGMSSRQNQYGPKARQP